MTIKTIIIFSTFQDTKGKDDFFEKIAVFNDLELQCLLSSIILKETTNTYISPELLQSYSKEKNRKIFETLNRKNRELSIFTETTNLFVS